jgi:hypothetical protein
MDGIAEMFAELDGYTRYEDALNIRASWKRARAVEAMRQWRRDNPKRAREQNRRYAKAWRVADPERWRVVQRARKARYRTTHLEHVRARDRRNQAAARARKKASAS